ncbi:MAG TPA: hypothetical protein VNF69_05320 [Burkholderiales bacterium]|nr:hypothetical protein [Burkholderiales bacterium]
MLRILAVALFAISGLALAAPAETAERGPIVREAGADRFVAGGSAIVSKPVAGDLYAAGGDLDLGA